MLVSESSATHQLRRRWAQKPQLDLIADRPGQRHIVGSPDVKSRYSRQAFLLQAQVEALRILRIDVPLSAKRQFQLFCSEHFPGLADIVDCLAADQLWALLSMRVQLANSDQLQVQSAAVRFGGLGRRYVLVAFNDRSVGLLSHADGSGRLPEARPKLTAFSWEEIRLALMLDIGSN
jgi:hypothetical protein